MPSISIKPEVIFRIFNFPVTNSLLSSEIVLLVFFVMAVAYNSQAGKINKSGFFYFFNAFVKMLYDLFYTVTKEKTRYFFALFFTFFVFIIMQNWFGLLPLVGSLLVRVKEGGETVAIPLFRGGDADLNTTFAFAIISVVMVQYFGVKFVGLKKYLSKFFNFANPINFFAGLLEIEGEISHILSFAFRLFGNIFAGEVLLTIISFLVPVLASFPFVVMEFFFGFIQALIFSMLTAVFIGGAIEAHH